MLVVHIEADGPVRAALEAGGSIELRIGQSKIQLRVESKSVGEGTGDFLLVDANAPTAAPAPAKPTAVSFDLFGEEHED